MSEKSLNPSKWSEEEEGDRVLIGSKYKNEYGIIKDEINLVIEPFSENISTLNQIEEGEKEKLKVRFRNVLLEYGNSLLSFVRNHSKIQASSHQSNNIVTLPPNQNLQMSNELKKNILIKVAHKNKNKLANPIQNQITVQVPNQLYAINNQEDIRVPVEKMLKVFPTQDLQKRRNKLIKREQALHQIYQKLEDRLQKRRLSFKQLEF